MISHVLVGTNDKERAIAFYDAVLGEMGATEMFSNERGKAYQTSPEAPKFGVMTPADGNAATVGNGSMPSFAVADTDTVDRVHAKALELGGTDEGAPGSRGDGGIYMGYFRDLDGNKLGVACMTG